ncbi:MAG: hypothetical protein ACHQKZ_09725 [Solirubrobacterales bacterium]
MTEPTPQRLAAFFAVTSAVAVLAIYAGNAAALLAYPWDWSPDEGSPLAYARLLLADPGSFYDRDLVPAPYPYTPLLPALLVPMVAWSAEPLLPARILACGWALLSLGSVYVLVRRKAAPSLALAATALVVAPMTFSLWHLLVRMDGLMIALWLAAAAVLLPPELRRGADRLGSRRLALGAALLLAAVLAKPTAAFHGAPLVLGWLLVDVRSALRLSATLAAAGTIAFALLLTASSGGFLFVMGLWRHHPPQPGLRRGLLLFFLEQTLPLLLLAAAGAIAALRRGRAPLRESALLLVAGGLTVLPMLEKSGASWNYLVPLQCAVVVLAARLWGDSGWKGLGAALAGAAALALVATQTFPLPDATDRRTATAFYGFIRDHVTRQDGPIFATWPEMAYFVAGQPVEIEGSGAVYVARARVRGIEEIERSLTDSRYTLVVTIPYVWRDPTFATYIDGHYRPIGECLLRYYYGTTPFTFLVRKGDPTRFDPPAGTRCASIPPGADQ